MQVAFLPASSGWQWIRDGFRLFRKQALSMYTLALVNSLLMVFAFVLLPIGPILYIALMPSVTLMSLTACRHIKANRLMLPSMWLHPLKQPGVFRNLFLMGLLYAAVNLTAGLVAFLPFSDAFSESLRIAATGRIEDSIENSLAPILLALHAPLILFTIFYLIIAALFWYAPVLVAWHRLRLLQALFFSGVACWRNKWAFLVYAVTWVLLILLLDKCSTLLIAIGLPVQLTSTLQIPVMIAATSVFYCSFYPSYTCVFGSNRPGPNFDDSHSAQA